MLTIIDQAKLAWREAHKLPWWKVFGKVEYPELREIVKWYRLKVISRRRSELMEQIAELQLEYTLADAISQELLAYIYPIAPTEDSDGTTQKADKIRTDIPDFPD